MIAIADDRFLYLLEFIDARKLDRKMESLKQNTKSEISLGRTSPIDSIEKELKRYFDGHLKEFKTPLCFLGTTFQKRVWIELQKIPYGETRSYAEVAKKIGKPTAYRAVAMANSSNKLAVIVPCHRVINANGDMGGYAGGVPRKIQLLTSEE